MGKLVRTAATLAAFFLAAPAFAGDIVVYVDGKTDGNKKASNPPAQGDFASSTWEILEENLDLVTYRLEGVPTPQTVPTSKIRSFFHDPARIPAKLKAGVSLSDRRQFDEARAAFEAVTKDSSAPVWAKAEAAYRLADTYFQQGDAAGAEKAYAGFKGAYAKSRWVTDATERRARCLLALNRVDDARGEFGAMKKMPGVDEATSLEADYWLAWIDETVAAAKNDEAGLNSAAKAYDALASKLSGKSALEGLLRRTQVGRASCLMGTGKAAEARDILTKLSAETKDPRALAAIYNKLGTAILRAAAAGDREAMKSAQRNYLRVIVLYKDEDGAEDDIAEAHYNAGILFRELKETPDAAGRARREWQECVARFPGSPWARKSQDALAGR